MWGLSRFYAIMGTYKRPWEGVVNYRLWCWRSVFAFDFFWGVLALRCGFVLVVGGLCGDLFLYLFGFCLLQDCCLIDISPYLSLFLFMPLPPTSHAFHTVCQCWMKTRSERRLAWTMREKTIIIWISMYRSRVSKCTLLLRLYRVVLDIWIFTVQPNINLAMDKWWTSSYFVLLYKKNVHHIHVI